MKYDAKDFARNPAKYTTFKTATIAQHVLTENGTDDLPAGRIVGIDYQFTVRNHLRRRMEPVYRIRGTQHMLFASALCDFVL